MLNILNMLYTLRFFSSKCSLFHNANLFGSCIIHILYTGCTKLKKNNSGAKGLSNNRSCNYSCTSSWWWVSTSETCRVAYRNIINWISRFRLVQHRDKRRQATNLLILSPHRHGNPQPQKVSALNYNNWNEEHKFQRFIRKSLSISLAVARLAQHFQLTQKFICLLVSSRD